APARPTRGVASLPCGPGTDASSASITTKKSSMAKRRGFMFISRREYNQRAPERHFMSPLWSATSAIFLKDLRAELRSRELVSAMGLFSALCVLAFSFALELDVQTRDSVAGGVLWVTVTFAVILGLNRSMGGEREQGNLDAMLLAPAPRAA